MLRIVAAGHSTIQIIMKLYEVAKVNKRNLKFAGWYIIFVERKNLSTNGRHDPVT